MILLGQAAASIAAAADTLGAGGLLGLPTETVYGLAADAESATAVARIFAAKGRPADHPLIVHVADAAAAAHFANEVPAFAQALMQAFWPGPLTLILPRRPGVAAVAAGGQDSIGLRCPAHPVAQAVLVACVDLVPPVHGLAAPSANRFGRVSPTTAAHVREEFGPDLLVLDGGPCAVGIESTIVDCTRGQPVLLRPGAITPAELAAVCGQAVLLPQDLADTAPAAPRASGTLASHYAPRARVRLFTAEALRQSLVAWLAAKAPANLSSVGVYARTLPDSALLAAPGLQVRRMPPTAAATAQQLFAVLRELDSTGVAEIWVEIPPDAPDWAGVMDRLERAAA
jgi:L-threonylcarbamoyladenylate synthase